MKSYVCIPKKKDRPARMICLGCLTFSVVSFYLATLSNAFTAFGQLLSVLSLLAVVWISSKFILTVYRYALEGDLLHLSLTQGKRIKNLGTLPLNEPFFLLTKEEWDKRKKEFPLKERYSFCQNLVPEAPFYFLRPDEGKFILVVLEGDKTLFDPLKDRKKKEV